MAYDPVKQEIRWRVPVGNSRFGGTLSTASGLVFQVAPDGRLIAYSADKGDVLLELRTGLQNGMGPPITFAIDGKQYIALMGGSGGRQSLGTTNPGAVTSQMKPQLVGIWLGRQSRAAQTRGHASTSLGGSTPIADNHVVNIDDCGFRPPRQSTSEVFGCGA